MVVFHKCKCIIAIKRILTTTATQARNQFGIPVGGEEFLRGVQNVQ